MTQPWFCASPVHWQRLPEWSLHCSLFPSLPLHVWLKCGLSQDLRTSFCLSGRTQINAVSQAPWLIFTFHPWLPFTPSPENWNVCCLQRETSTPPQGLCLTSLPSVPGRSHKSFFSISSKGSGGFCSSKGFAGYYFPWTPNFLGWRDWILPSVFNSYSTSGLFNACQMDHIEWKWIQ